jgi:starvation-inducible DNA-binding protein
MNASIPSVLQQLFADYTVLYHKVRGYHWNVRGPDFFTLHVEFETLYTALALRIDELAERLLALDASPQSSLERILSTARLTEEAGTPEARAMVERTAHDLATLNGWVKDGIEAAEAAGDTVTSDLLTQFVVAQAKTAWMFRAWLGR